MEATAFIVAAALAAAMTSQGDARYACGGAGAEERAELAALRPQANAELLFVTAKRGGYLADVEVSISRDGRPVLKTVAAGPICLLALPAGSYRIEARYQATVRVQTLKVPATRAVFAFPEEAWDGVRATPEERQQGKEAR